MSAVLHLPVAISNFCVDFFFLSHNMFCSLLLVVYFKNKIKIDKLKSEENNLNTKVNRNSQKMQE